MVSCMPKQDAVRTPWKHLTVLREKDGQTKTALATALGISLSHLCDLETGRREPTDALVKTAAQVLNVPLSMLEKKRRWQSAA